ncbi:hypothetical protein ABBQ38_002899 [Trebouxia sp. C0009 RCD-2024]
MAAYRNMSPILEDITRLLDAVEAPGAFACGFRDPSAVLPGLSVAGFGDVELPLDPERAKALLQMCKPAPFGKGPDSVIDTNIRKDLSTRPCTDHLQQPWYAFPRSTETILLHCWQDYLTGLTDKVATELGVSAEITVQAQLYKLLLYQAGDHFAVHRDTEKAPGMFATMTIVLPSEHTGGDLHIQHGKGGMTFQFGAASAYYLQCGAFYAGKQSGYRLALIYNLVSAGGKSKRVVKDKSRVTSKIAEAVQKWGATAQGPKRGIYMLSHKYTEAGLKGLSSLKAKDRQVGNVLQAVAASGCLDVYLAFISKEEQCSAEIVKRKWEVTEVFETSWAARDWLSLDGTKPTFYETDIDTNHIMQGEEWFDGVKVDKEERNSYTGNAGPTMDRCHPSSSSLTAYPVSFRTEYFSCSVEGTLQPVKCTRACTFCLGADRQW